MTYVVTALAVLMLLAVVLFIRRQRSLQLRAHLMREAIRNHDFTFGLPTDGLLPGERAMQETLNQLGDAIHQQVSQSEVKSWERLTRVLTHEIMNATAPIVSISQTLLTRDDVKGTPLEESIRAIHSTSQHLSTFVDSYRKLSQLQNPIIERVHLASQVKDIMQLYPDIQWDCAVSNTLTVDADPNMLRQILINLVKNAIEAGARHISLKDNESAERAKACTKDSKSKNRNPSSAILYVSNDGAPIPTEAIHNIFIPFFTTKRTGTGIGLPLSHRMMMMQGGNLRLEDIPLLGFHTTFSLEWPSL